MHDKATRGGALTAQEQAQLDEWCRQQDAAESQSMVQANIEGTVAALRGQVAEALAQVQVVAADIQNLAGANEALRREVAALQERVAERAWRCWRMRSAVPSHGPAIEGSARKGRKEFRRFLDIALSSLAEVGYALRFAKEVGLLDEGVWQELNQRHNRARCLTWQLYRALRGEKPPPTFTALHRPSPLLTVHSKRGD